MGLRKVALKSLAIFLVIVAITSCRQSKPAWNLYSDWSNIAIITLDYQTMALKTVYFTNQVPCDSRHSAMSDEDLKSRAIGLFHAIQAYGGENFDVSYAGDLAVLYDAPSDFGGVAVFHRCSGLALFAGSLVWMGGGEQFYPPRPIDSDAIQHTRNQPLPPQQVDVMSGSEAYSDREKGLVAWNSVADLNIVKDLASSPYTVLVYLYPQRTISNSADWVIFVQRSPQAVLDTGPTSTPSPTITWPTRISPLPTAQPLLSPISTPQP